MGGAPAVGASGLHSTPRTLRSAGGSLEETGGGEGFRVGSEIKATLKKSRFGTQGRQASFKILWGDNVGIQDEESWFEAIKGSEYLKQSGAWYSLQYKDGTEEKFQPSKWKNMLTSQKFRDRILEIMDEEVVVRFDKRTGDASDYYENE